VFTFSVVVGCAVLCCAVLYCIVLYCAVLYCTVLYCTVQYRICEDLLVASLEGTLYWSGNGCDPIRGTAFYL
jgi:hypothetical protein